MKLNPLKRWLKKSGWTREALARELGMSTVFVIGLANERNTDIRVSTLLTLHQVTEIPLEELTAWLDKCSQRNKKEKQAS